MRVIGVIDIRGGLAVHASGGSRDGYRPVRRIADVEISPGSVAGLVAAYREEFGIEELYIADLDAIAGGEPHHRLIADAAALSAGAIWLDAGVSSVPAARRARAVGASRVIVGLETLESWEALSAICTELGSMSVVFGLDLRAGAPVTAAASAIETEPAEMIARRAFEQGVTKIVVLDLARIGRAEGVDYKLIRRLRAMLPQVEIVAGGGIGSTEDLDALAGAGCDAALVATALHDGRIRRDQLHARLTR